MGPLELINHGGPVGAAKDFKSRRPADEVVADHTKRLEREGWKVVESHMDPRHPRFVRFCKGVTGADLTIWKEAGGVSYRISFLIGLLCFAAARAAIAFNARWCDEFARRSLN